MSISRSLSFHHLLSAKDIQKSDVLSLLATAKQFHDGLQKKPNQFLDIARGKILASLFFEPSTRTRFSFEAAMLRLGGNMISLESGATSSVKKGESLADTGKIVSGYTDIIVMRHPEIGSAAQLASQSAVPVINAGDGPAEHPSQSLLDLYTIQHFQNRLENLTFGLVGDLKFSRTIKSLIQLLVYFPNQTFYLISHPSLRMDPDLVTGLKAAGHQVIETDNMAEALPKLDVLYMTRIQQERFETPEAYLAVKDHFSLSRSHLTQVKPNLSILHPLPRVHEMNTDLDSHPAAHYFYQAQFGVYVRMALMAHIL